MDLDRDVDNCWPLDEISFMSPVCSSELPYSPLWELPDATDYYEQTSTVAETVVTHANSASITDPGVRIADYPLFLIGKPDSNTENLMEINGNKRSPSPVGGLINTDADCLIKEKMTHALRFFKESTDQHVLAQVWAPVKNGNRNILSTLGQPFVLDSNSNELYQYRTVSLMYMFSVDGENDEELGLPGRVFKQKSPEWTPNVQYYRSGEYSRLDYALHYNVHGTLALPLFEPSGNSCIGVLELITTSTKIDYAPEVDKICKALEAVNLKSSDTLDHTSTQICNESRRNALAEILEVLTVVCETHKIPLAQTWVPCHHGSVLAHGGGLKKSCTSFDGNCMGKVCMSTTDVAFYIIDSHMWGFRKACVEHHLQKGQGAAGRAFLSHNSCFCPDVTQFCKTEYPIVHYARMFNLTGCFAICLRSSHTGDDDYILEFFVPSSDHKTLLGSLLATMKEHFQSLRFASGIDLEEEGLVEIIQVSSSGKPEFEFEFVKISKSMNGGDMSRVDSLKRQISLDDDDIGRGGGGSVQTNGTRVPILFLEDKSMESQSERKRGKAEKTISLEVLQEHFAGSLKDAAKKLGVCPTTMKRICRQHGITRWPSRKINKVNRSLTKLKRVIESVDGGERTFNLATISSNPSPLPLYNSNGLNQQGSRKTELPTFKPSEIRQASHGDQLPEWKNPSHDRSPTSHGSCQRSPADESPCIKLGSSNLESADEPLESFREMLIEDAGSSKDLQNLCSTDAIANERIIRSVTIKATYKEDIIRLRFSQESGIMKLKEEVAKRLKLEIGTFDIRYMDDDHELVLITCDADLQECIDISRSSSINIIRLLIHDVFANLGSSCESTMGFEVDR